MAHELLLQPGNINGMAMRNKLITGPMERSLANRDGSLNQTYTDYLTERAKGGASLIIIESTYIDTRGMGNIYQVGCHSDHVVPALRRAADAVHSFGANLGTELYFGGRVTSSTSSQRQPMGPSAIPCEVLDPMPIPRELTVVELREIVESFVAAAHRVVAAGLDMVHLHGAHGYLLGAFLSPFTNHRTDEYGGSLENRARLGVETIKAVREAVGDTFPIGYRMSAEEYVDGGLTVDDAAGAARLYVEAGADLIDVSGGIYETVHMITQGPEAPKGGFVSNAHIIKHAVGDRALVSVAQRLNDPVVAEDVLRSGLDYITLTRAFHADPHYVNKLRENVVEDIIPCIACHRCGDLLAESQNARCATNPATALERRRKLGPTKRARHVAIVGGGPAGMQTARLLAGSGHNVVLFEQHGELGGQIRFSSRVAPDYGKLVEYLEMQMTKLRVDLRLGVKFGVEILYSEDFDAIVVASGAIGGGWYCPVSPAARTFDLFTALDRPDDDWEEEEVVIIGGDSESCFLALYIAGGGGTVHIVEPRREISYDRGAVGRGALLETIAHLPTVEVHLESTVEEVGDTFVTIQSAGVHQRVGGINSTVIGGRVANNTIFDDLLIADIGIPVHNIGDAVMPRDIYAASHDAAQIAEFIHLPTTA